MEDFDQSLHRAMIRQGWLFDDRWSRIGSPFTWVDGEQMKSSTRQLSGIHGVLQALTMYYEEYNTPDVIRTAGHDRVWQDLQDHLATLLRDFFPLSGSSGAYDHNVRLTALARTQDFCFLDSFCPDLVAKERPDHLDIGPGLGSHAIYSLKHLNANYTGVEAVRVFYDIQRHFYRHLARVEKAGYFDPVSEEFLETDLETIGREVSECGNHRLKHVPSWHFDMIPDQSQDLVTATFVLNEVGPAGIVWLLGHASRCLREGGVFYIRDSRKNKPNRHGLKYDDALLELGFEEIAHLDVENRVDMFGLPRAYRKIDHRPLGFEDLFERYFGRFAVTVHQGGFMQNMPKSMQS